MPTTSGPLRGSHIQYPLDGLYSTNAVRIIDRLNIFAGQHKNWLPPVYGKKHYQDMTPEEQAVIDEFQGEAAYESVLADPSMLISAGDIALAALPSSNP